MSIINILFPEYFFCPKKLYQSKHKLYTSLLFLLEIVLLKCKQYKETKEKCESVDTGKLWRKLSNHVVMKNVKFMLAPMGSSLPCLRTLDPPLSLSAL